MKPGIVSVRALCGTIALLAIAAGIVSVGLLGAEALLGLGCTSCSPRPEPPAHAFWRTAADIALLLSIAVFVISAITAVVVKRQLSPFRSARAFRAIGVAAIAFAALCGGVVADFNHADDAASVLRVVLYVATVATIIATVAAIGRRTPPEVPPAKVVSE